MQKVYKNYNVKNGTRFQLYTKMMKTVKLLAIFIIEFGAPPKRSINQGVKSNILDWSKEWTLE